MSRHVTAPALQMEAAQLTDEIRHQLERRAFLAANELRNASQLVLRGQRHGRRYKIPGTYAKQKDHAAGKVRRGRYYTASAPGEAPALRTGAFRLSWRPTSLVNESSFLSRIDSDLQTEKGGHTLGEILEEGTSRMEPRPYQDRILEKAERPILRIYNEPYF